MLAFLRRFQKLSQVSGRERLLALVTLGIFFLFALDRFLLGPILRQMRTTQAEIRTLEGTLRNTSQLLRRKEILLLEIKRHELYLKPVESVDTEIARFLKEVEALAQKSQLSLSNVNSLPAAEEGRFQRFTVEVNCESTLSQWMEFVYLLESSESLIEIERGSLALEKEGEEKLKGNLRISRLAVRP